MKMNVDSTRDNHTETAATLVAEGTHPDDEAGMTFPPRRWYDNRSGEHVKTQIGWMCQTTHEFTPATDVELAGICQEFLKAAAAVAGIEPMGIANSAVVHQMEWDLAWALMWSSYDVGTRPRDISDNLGQMSVASKKNGKDWAKRLVAAAEVYFLQRPTEQKGLPPQQDLSRLVDTLRGFSEWAKTALQETCGQDWQPSLRRGCLLGFETTFDHL